MYILNSTKPQLCINQSCTVPSRIVELLQCVLLDVVFITGSMEGHSINGLMYLRIYGGSLSLVIEGISRLRKDECYLLPLLGEVCQGHNVLAPSDIDTIAIPGMQL